MPGPRVRRRNGPRAIPLAGSTPPTRGSDRVCVLDERHTSATRGREAGELRASRQALRLACRLGASPARVADARA